MNAKRHRWAGVLATLALTGGLLALAPHLADARVADVCPLTGDVTEAPGYPAAEPWTKIDAGSGSASGAWGSFVFSGSVLMYRINDGWVLEFCIKSGAGTGDGDKTANHIVIGPSIGQIEVTDTTGKPKDISHVSWRILQRPTVVLPGQWCSPGYWKQPQHLGSWVATGISTDSEYNFWFDPDLPGNPTLLQVLQSPKVYGGARTNLVADLLSFFHPDVNYTGVRVPDSCPLGRSPGTS